MSQLIFFIIITAFGTLVGKWTNINPVEQAVFSPFTTFALIVGLYGSVVGIDLSAIRQRRWLAVIVITVAVPIQIMASGALMYLIYPASISFLLAVAMTQIDPLSVDTLLQDKESMSQEAKGILRVWASFDDPVTVLFGFLILLPLITGQAIEGSVTAMLLGLMANVGVAFALWALGKWTKVLQDPAITLVLLLLTLIFAFFTQAFLLAAITGLLLRPVPEKYLGSLTAVLYYGIVFVVGMAMYTYGIDLRLGFLLAIVGYFVIQPLTTIIVFSGSSKDLLRIAFAQQNGLTTLLMGIAFQNLGFKVLHILLPAIIITNMLNLIVNKILSWKEAQGLFL